MKLLVSVKRVIDYHIKVRVKSDGSGVETNRVKMSMNPFDEIAVEAAVRLKEQGFADEIVAVSIGVEACQETLRHALALGVDRALLIQTDMRVEPLHVAKILKCVVAREKPGLVLLGKQAIDDDCNQTGQMLAGLLNWPQATFASHLKIVDQKATVAREVDAGLETVCLNLPAVLTTDLRLNEPRYPSMPNIMKAKQKPLEIQPLSELPLSLEPHSQILEVEAPPTREAGVMLENFDALLDTLKNKVKVL